MEKQKFFVDKIYKIYRLRESIISSNYIGKRLTTLEYVSTHDNESDAEYALMELDNFVSYTILPVYSKQVDRS